MIRNLLLVLFSAARLGGHEKAPAPLGPVVPRRLARSMSSSVKASCFGGGCKPHKKPIVKQPPIIVRPPVKTSYMNTSNERVRINTSKPEKAYTNWGKKNPSDLSKPEAEELYARHNRVYGPPTELHGRTRQTKGRPQLLPSKWEGSEHQTEMTKALMEKDTHRYFSKQGLGAEDERQWYTNNERRQRQEMADEVERNLMKTGLDEKKKAYDYAQFKAETLQLEAELSQRKKPLHKLLAEGSYDFTSSEAKEISRLHEIAQDKGVRLKHLRARVQEAEGVWFEAEQEVIRFKAHERRQEVIGEAREVARKLGGEHDELAKWLKKNETEYYDAKKALAEAAGESIKKLESSGRWHEHYFEERHPPAPTMTSKDPPDWTFRKRHGTVTKLYRKATLSPRDRWQGDKRGATSNKKVGNNTVDNQASQIGRF